MPRDPHPAISDDEDSLRTIKGFEIMRMIRRRHWILCEPNVAGEILFVNKPFEIAA